MCYTNGIENISDVYNCIEDIKFEIKETVGIIAESAKGWKKELNLISWNGKEAKYDLRECSLEHVH